MNKRDFLRALYTTPFIAFALLVAGCSAGGSDFGEVTDATRDRDFRYEVFLPPDTTAGHPLVVFSHGSGGNYHGHRWLIDALVQRGYAVAALNHPHNNSMDNTDEGVMRVWDRPADISRLLDNLLADARFAPRIDPQRIGVAGHSSGGYTAIALAGAVFNPGVMEDYCTGPDRGPDCDLANPGATVDYRDAAATYRDLRIRAAVAMAPAVGPALEPGSLATIDIPVLVLATLDDEILPFEQHARHYADSIPSARLHLLEGGGHFIYMECTLGTRVADWFIDNLDLCGAGFSVDREALRASIAAEVLEFFDTNLASGV